MNTEPKHLKYGLTVSEWIAKTPAELDDDAVGLWQIIKNGRLGFGLEGEALGDFVVRSVVEFVKAGAQPSVHSLEGERFWRAKPGYGEQPEEIASNVVAEWQKTGEDPDVSGLWFALP